MHLQIKRAYEAPAESDGTRILVDRLWPRGMTKDRLKLDLWLKDISPSPALRKWFGHDPDRFTEFAKQYRAELRRNPLVQEVAAMAHDAVVTLVYGARDPACNHALVLKDVIEHAA
jgi:uncharacterized protein YeaO (DUF488 family)